MELTGVAATSLLSLVLLLAGSAKSRDRAGTARAAEGFGLPTPVARAASWGVPMLEVALGVAVWVPAVHSAAAWMALALLVGFTGAVAVTLLRGRRVACACFGALDDSEVDGWTLLRNSALIAVAGLSATSPTWPTGEPARTVAVVVVPLVAMAALLVYLVRLLLELSQEYATLVARIDVDPIRGEARSSRIEPDLVPAGSPLTLRLSTPGGEALAAAQIFTAPASLLVVADPGCRACTAMMPELALWAAEHPEVPVVVSARVPMRKAEATMPPASSMVVVDREHTAHRGLGRPSLPAAVLVADDGRTASPVAAGAEAVLHLLDSLGSRPALGQLPVVSGDEVARLVDAVGGDADLLFVSPSCSHCGRLAEILDEAEIDLVDPVRRRPVVVVSSGSAAATRSLGIDASATVHDLDGSLLAASGAPGTPSLVTMADGRLAGSVVAGAPAVAETLMHRGPTRHDGRPGPVAERSGGSVAL